MRLSSRMIVAACATCLAGLLPAGCVKPARTGRPAARVQPNSIAVDLLAGYLGLDVEEMSPSAATLKRPGAIVMIFADPGGQVYVNGRAMAPAGAIQSDGGVIRISRRMARAVRSALATIPNGASPGRAKNSLPPPAGWAGHASVVIDAGHGGSDVGTDTALRNFRIPLHEKDVNLSISLLLAKLLRRGGVRVHLTRTTDSAVPLDRRVAISNRLGPDLFVSIHANMLGDSSFHGFMVFVTPSASARSMRAAKIIVRHMAATGLLNRGIRRKKLRVVTNTTAPAVLVETAFLSNRADAMVLASPAGRARIAAAIADAVIEYLEQ